MRKIKEIIVNCSNQKWNCLFLFLIIFCGGFLRVYHYSDWMHFELDQARDIFVVFDVLDNGLEELPLVGPQARGRELYLGPIFYYFQVASGAIFGVSPEMMALPDLIFSIAAIPLFYLFARLFFTRYISLWLTVLFATSLYLVIYGRFAWNPNAMVFWSLVTFYGLLRAWDAPHFYLRWFLLAVAGLGIVTQLHFIAFIAAPLIFFVYILLVRMRVPWRAIFASIAIGALLYAPVIVYDVSNNGTNIRAFVASVTMSPDADAHANTASDRDHDIIEQSFRALQESATFYWHMLSADDHGRYNIRTKKNEQGYFPLICDKKCMQALPYHIVAIVIFVGTLLFFVGSFFRTWKTAVQKQQKDLIKKRDRSILIGLWLFFSGIFLILVAYQISPRFYLFVVVPFYIVFGMLMEKIVLCGRWGKVFAGMIFVVLIFSNMFMAIHYFSLFARATHDTVEWRDIAMNRSDLVTLSQLRLASAYVSEMMSGPFVIVGDNRYARALYYLNAFEDDNDHARCYIKSGGFDPRSLEGVPYALFVRTASKSHVNDDMSTYHTIESVKEFGTVMVYILKPRHETSPHNEKIKSCFVR
jgi:4-amino-4-deoxy-L-arabinose transferase-like glycosyltransferase